MVGKAGELGTQGLMRILKIEGGKTISDCGVSTLSKYFYSMDN